MSARYDQAHGPASVFSAVILLACHGPAFAGDLFVGTYKSETRENFGTDRYGEYVLKVKSLGNKYMLSLSKDGASMGEIEGIPCGTEKEGYLSGRPSGEARTLCSLVGQATEPLFSYSQNGISIPAVAKTYKAKYYMRIQWTIRGFRKVE